MIGEFIHDAITRAISSVVGIFAPSMAMEYARNRSLLKRAYSAAKATGPNQLWKPTGSSAAKEIAMSGTAVRNRARDLERNNPYIAGLARKWVANTVGEGMWPKAKVLGADGKLDAEINSEIESRWERWQETAGINGDSFVEIQQQGARHLLIDGEFLIRRIQKPGVPLALQLLECDFLDTAKDSPDLGNGSRIVGGIELDAYDRPVSYHLFSAHPADKGTTSTPVPASEIIHVFDRQRASQVRGICAFASVISEIFDTVEYQDSILTLARVATAFGVFVQSPNPSDWMPATGGTTNAAGAPEEYVTPGGIHKLLPGETIAQVKPENPGSNYDPFVRSRLRAASTGIGVSYESFSNDYSQVSYSSARQAMIVERALYRVVSNLIDSKLNQRVYRWFLDNETSLAAPGVRPLALAGYAQNPRPYWRVKFSRPRQEWIDPAKEAGAAKDRLAIGLETLTELAENEGRDIDEVMATRAAEIERMQELGIFQIDPAVEAFSTVSESKTVDASEDVNGANDQQGVIQ